MGSTSAAVSTLRTVAGVISCGFVFGGLCELSEVGLEMKSVVGSLLGRSLTNERLSAVVTFILFL